MQTKEELIKAISQFLDDSPFDDLEAREWKKKMPQLNEQELNELQTLLKEKLSIITDTNQLFLDIAGQTVVEQEKAENELPKSIIITNLKRSDLNPALISRVPVYEMNFNSKEIVKSLQDLLKYINPSISLDIKQEVLNYVLELYRKDPTITIDFRAFKSSVDARVGNPTMWKEMVKVITNYKGK